MNNASKKLAEALEALLDVQNGSPLISWEKEWDKAMEMSKQALAEYRAEEGKQKELVPLDEKKVKSLLYDTYYASEPHNQLDRYSEEICKKFGTRKVSVEEIMQVIDDCGITKDAVTKVNMYVLAKEIYKLIYGESK